MASCPAMCPVAELKMRERERLLHPLECMAGTEKDRLPKADPNRTVKQYSRSAAGLDLTKEDRLRPPDVLRRTVDFLLETALNDDRFSFALKNDFIVDRLRSVSQDIVVQRLSPEKCIDLYGPIVKYHIYSGYRLCEENISVFDPTLHKKQLMEYLHRSLVCYDDMDDDNIRNDPRTSDKAIYDRSLIEGINLIVNLGERDPLMRYLTLPKIYRTEMLKTCFYISLNFMTNNYVRILMQVSKLEPLLLCAVAVHLPAIRRQAYRTMSTAFNSKNLTYPLGNLKCLLLYENEADVKNDCLHYGLTVSNGEIQFRKENYNASVKTKTPNHLKLIDKKLNLKSLFR